MLYRLWRIRCFEAEMPHVDGHVSRLAFIDDVMRCYNQDDPKFNKLVDSQLDLHCNGHLDSRTFCRVCNDPKHPIRNRMITWSIDHPKARQEKP